MNCGYPDPAPRITEHSLLTKMTPIHAYAEISVSVTSYAALVIHVRCNFGFKIEFESSKDTSCCYKKYATYLFVLESLLIYKGIAIL